MVSYCNVSRQAAEAQRKERFIGSPDSATWTLAFISTGCLNWNTSPSNELVKVPGVEVTCAWPVYFTLVPMQASAKLNEKPFEVTVFWLTDPLSVQVALPGKSTFTLSSFREIGFWANAKLAVSSPSTTHFAVIGWPPGSILDQAVAEVMTKNGQKNMKLRVSLG
jgi:hypothetical protein